MEAESTKYVSFILTGYLDAITCLIEEQENIHAPNDTTTKEFPPENGLSASIIVLSVLLIESAINRVRYVLGQKVKKNEHPVDFVHQQFPESGCFEKLEELFAIRDAIAHNHVWEREIIWEQPTKIRVRSTRLHEGFGNKRFEKVLDINSYRTKILGINVIPSKVNRNDAKAALKTVTEFLLFLEHQNLNYVRISPLGAIYKGKLTRFIDIVTNL